MRIHFRIFFGSLNRALPLSPAAELMTEQISDYFTNLFLPNMVSARHPRDAARRMSHTPASQLSSVFAPRLVFAVLEDFVSDFLLLFPLPEDPPLLFFKVYFFVSLCSGSFLQVRSLIPALEDVASLTTSHLPQSWPVAGMTLVLVFWQRLQT